MSAIPQVSQDEKEDLNLSIPPDVLLTSFEPRFQFNWQNPELCKDIYPFRNEKLIDFLAFYAEVDLVKKYRGQHADNPQVVAQIQSAEAALRDERREIDRLLEGVIAERRAADKYFDKISVKYQNDPERLRKNYVYYLDREIDRLEGKLGGLEDRQKELIKRKTTWWPDSPERQQDLQAQADALNPDIDALRQELAPMKELLRLLQKQAELPDAESTAISIEAVMRWELRLLRQEWEKLDAQALLKTVIERINLEPDHFPEWLVYMLVHFSGMRYISAHGSWADPRDLLELLRKEDMEDEVKSLAGEALAQACNAAIQELEARLEPGMAEADKKSIDNQIARLRNEHQRQRALQEYRAGQIADSVKGLSEKECLDGLVAYRASKALAGDPVPDWMWNEIVKFTPLRLNTTDDNWEAISPERWKAQMSRWTQVLNEWEKKDITGWRKKHAQSLELVVTRSVCNEIAEHIQHLRGHVPYAGLTSKPKWYLKMVEDKVFGPFSYLIQAPDEKYFIPGASILWLQWMEQRPSPWQVATFIPGYTFYPGQGSGEAKKGQKGETRKQDLVDKDWDEAGGWRTSMVGNTFQRVRNKPNQQELRRMGKSPDEIQKILAEYRKTGAQTTEYLRWRHEATVVDVVEMIDGKYVLTFETGKIGIIRRRLSDLRGNPLIFVGFVPEVEALSEEMDSKLVNMLRWDRILPEAPLAPRVRPKKAPWPKPADEAPGDTVAQELPQRQVIVIREQVRCQEIFGQDNQGRPKFRGAAQPVKLSRGDLLNIFSTHKESRHDKGDGILQSGAGEFVKISQCEANPKAVGKFVRRDEIEFMDQGKWMQFVEATGKLNFQVLKSYDLSKFRKPVFEPTPEANKVVLDLGAPGVDRRVRVSTIHKECPLDKGDGLIHSTGLQWLYYLVLECPAQPKAGGYFVKEVWVKEG